MLRKSILCLFLLATILNNFIFSKASAEENDGCFVLKDDTIVCEEDIPEGCYFDINKREIECPIDPLEIGDKYPRG